MKTSELLYKNRTRFDLAIKYLFFKAIDTGYNYQFYENLYKKHVYQRTRGIEPPDLLTQEQYKNSVDSYVEKAEELYFSMKENGFLPSSKIPISPTGGLLNGAHRLACAAYLGIQDLSCTLLETDSPLWNFDCLEEYGEEEQLAVLRGYLELHGENSTIGILFNPSFLYLSEIETMLRNEGFDIIWIQDMNLESNNERIFHDLLFDIYSNDVSDFKNGFDHIHRKIEKLSGFSSSLKIVVLNHNSEDIYERSDESKEKIRLELNRYIPEKDYITIHMASSKGEKNYMKQILLGYKNLYYLKQRLFLDDRSEMSTWLTYFNKVLGEYGIQKEDCIVVGSSPLEIFGVRKSTDIDFTVTSSIRRKYFDEGITHISADLDVVTEWYSRAYVEEEKLDDDMLVHDERYFFYFRGFKFAVPKIVYDRKKWQGRLKDLRDVEIMDKMFSGDRFHREGYNRNYFRETQEIKNEHTENQKKGLFIKKVIKNGVEKTKFFGITIKKTKL